MIITRSLFLDRFFCCMQKAKFIRLWYNNIKLVWRFNMAQAKYLSVKDIKDLRRSFFSPVVKSVGITCKETRSTIKHRKFNHKRTSNILRHHGTSKEKSTINAFKNEDDIFLKTLRKHQDDNNFFIKMAEKSGIYDTFGNLDPLYRR